VIISLKFWLCIPEVGVMVLLFLGFFTHNVGKNFGRD
jgi:hypothetical protein